MIGKPNDWNDISINSFSKRLPMGAYVCIIRKIIDNPKDQYIDVEYDVVEGEYKSIAVDTYEAYGKWVHSFRVYYTPKSMWRFKKFIIRVEETNQGFEFNWDNWNCLVNKGIGLIIGTRQYYSTKDGSLKEALDVQDFCTATNVRENNLPSEPKVKEPKNPLPTAKMEEVSSEDDGQLPF